MTSKKVEENLNRSNVSMEEMEEKKGSRRNTTLWLFFAIVVIAIGWLWWSGVWSASAPGQGYQAVFLTNDQVYFGKLTNVNSQYPVLQEVYYLQVTQPLQPKDQNAPATQNVNLVKLGGELHGPEDEMRINRNQILFFENLRSDSPVVNGIKNYKESQKKK